MTAPNADSKRKTIHTDIPIDNSIAALDTHLNKVRIVMVNTTLPANIGSAARAMLTMGLTDLVVVDPKHPIDDSSRSHAAGAIDMLDNSSVVDTLDTAIADCQLVFAASSRQRHIPRPVVTPTQAAQIIMASGVSTAHCIQQVAVLFGREDRGLTNEELTKADYHIQIDANPTYPVLNVASAVQVIASFFYSTFKEHTSKDVTSKQNTSSQEIINSAALDIILRQVWDTPAISHSQKTQLQSRIIALMKDLQLIENDSPDRLRDLPNRLSRLLSRLQLDQKEYELINAIIAKVTHKL